MHILYVSSGLAWDSGTWYMRDYIQWVEVATSTTTLPIAERIQHEFRHVTDEELAALPQDGAAHIDTYLYKEYAHGQEMDPKLHDEDPEHLCAPRPKL